MYKMLERLGENKTTKFCHRFNNFESKYQPFRKGKQCTTEAFSLTICSRLQKGCR